MSTYTVTDPKSGRTVKLTGDSPPTEAELEHIFSTLATDPPSAVAPARGLLDTAVETAKGIIKSPLGMIEAGGNLIRKIPGVAAAENATGAYVDTGINTAATNTPQAIGKAIGDIGMTILPGGAVGKATKGAGLLTRMGAEAATAAGTSALQGGDPVTAGVLGAAVPGAGALLGTERAAAMRLSAEKKVAQALGATKERFKAIAIKRAPEILKRGISGNLETLVTDATAHAREAGKAIDTVLTEHGGQILPTKPVWDALEEAKRGFTIDRELSIPDAARQGILKNPKLRAGDSGKVIMPVVLDERPIKQLEQLQQTIAALGDETTVDKIVAVRRAWDEIVDQAGGYSHKASSTFGTPLAEKTEAWAKREGAGAIRKLLAQEVPDLKAVNREFAFWNDLKKVVTATQARKMPQDERLARAVTSIGASAVGAGAGYSSGESLPDQLARAGIGALIGPKIFSKLTSTEWRLVSAKLRNEFADALASGVPGRIASASARIAAVQGSKFNAPSPTRPAERVQP